MHDVETFAATHGLENIIPLLRKGALVAQDPENYEDIKGGEALTETEILALRSEVLNKWKQPVALYVTIITCSLGAAVQVSSSKHIIIDTRSNKIRDGIKPVPMELICPSPLPSASVDLTTTILSL